MPFLDRAGTIQFKEWIKDRYDENTIAFTTLVDFANWYEDETYEDYHYAYDIENSKLTTNYTPTVVFALAEASSGNYAPVCKLSTGKITIYAKEIPENNFVIPTIIAEYSFGLGNITDGGTNSKTNLNADNITLDSELDENSNNAVKNSVITTEVNKRLTVTDTMPTASADLLGQTRLYIGSTTTNYQEGGIYKCESDGQTPPTYSWNIKNKADIDLSLYKKIFTGTQATWNTLTDAQKKEYDIANITDDTEDSVVDEVADGDMRAVTSNAVFNVLSDDTESTSIVKRNFGGMVYLRIPSTVSCASVFSAIIGNKILKVGSGSSETYVIGYYGRNPIDNISFTSGTMKLSGGSTVVKSFQYNGSDAIGETVTLIGVVYTE